MNDSEQDFVALLQEHYDSFSILQDEDTVFVEHALFALRFEITEEDVFKIHSLKVHSEGSGVGRSIVKLVREYCEETILDEIIAVDVVDTAITFWEEMGFMECGSEYSYSV
ncbi:hypothetical protein A3C87_02455 [Candidatus Kaiserbacteria bacterium RIFCSPHIGHO2_02_FULL_49_34]|uniref:Uncharacterized protein n=1 Tax=Candidatus Kaiserbacteria bacterium RIFCSPHIGHO2_02_FULL_49_34 TaxID=1798491 RepID=A0A1F6DLM2_9BACT|nr:MAG: hypothetical protein A3C87_02455 [Candidatus Kaiserbacteria bacterium RIFCSPHIGHO2_02_FULL_49_34]